MGRCFVLGTGDLSVRPREGGNDAMKKILLLLVLAMFVFTSAAALAADQFFVIKDKNGLCKVIKAKDKTPTTIAGPFKTKDEANKAKAEKCPKPPPKEKK
jgi:hypothetical protein